MNYCKFCRREVANADLYNHMTEKHPNSRAEDIFESPKETAAKEKQQ